MSAPLESPVAHIVVLAPVSVLSYGVPASLAEGFGVGMAVRVPLGRRVVSGYVAAFPATAPPAANGKTMSLRNIIAVDNDKPMLPASLMALVLFASRYYRAAPGDMLKAALPHNARPHKATYRLSDQGRAQASAPGPSPSPAPASPLAPRPITKEEVLSWASARPQGFTATALCRALGGERQASLRLLRRLLAQSLAEPVAAKIHKPKQEMFVARAPHAVSEQIPLRQKRARRLWDLLPADGTEVSLCSLRAQDARAAGAAPKLREQGVITWRASDVRHSPWSASAPAEASAIAPRPSADQERALEAICADIERRAYSVSLLFGVTGSGKTEVYLQAIARVLAQGRTALVLVPEIALTPQLGARFRARFGALVATFHSGLRLAERRDEWQRVASGEARIALGARSAIFLPLDNLGIVIVDEEHESSFKQEESPHYNARDLAIWRGREASAVVVLGSATPSLESFHNVQLGRSRQLTLAGRAQGQALAAVDIIDVKQTPPVGDQLLSPPLVAEMDKTIARGEQVILFLNRRGFAPYIVCRDCGHSYRCHQCEVSLTLHRKEHKLVCHYCGHTEAPPETCMMCLGQRVDSFGPGIERLQAECKERFGPASTIRLDRDTIKTRADLTEALDAFRRGDAPIMLGTQMVAKGHDFPRVTLVGVVSADASLNFPDFRASERTFQLLTQVAGRAGRGALKGRVLVQAIDTTHDAIVAAAAQDFAQFATRELALREEHGYPPFAHVALVRIEGADLRAVERYARTVSDTMQPSGAQLLGPAPAPLARLRGQWRFSVLVKAPSRAIVQRAIACLECGPAPPHGLRRIVDIDPMQML